MRMLNAAQKAVLCVGLIVFVISSLYPQWIYAWKSEVVHVAARPAGRHFLLAPPIPGEHLNQLYGGDLADRALFCEMQIDLLVLMVWWVVVIVVTFGLLLLLSSATIPINGAVKALGGVLLLVALSYCSAARSDQNADLEAMISVLRSEINSLEEKNEEQDSEIGQRSDEIECLVDVVRVNYARAVLCN